MKKDTLQIGVKGFHVDVEILLPENQGDIDTVSKGNKAYQVSKFVRGYRIDLQEGGARQVVEEMVAGKDAALLKDPRFIAEVQKAAAAEVADFNPDAPRARGGRPRKPVVLALPKGKKTFTAAEVEAIAKASGLLVESK